MKGIKEVVTDQLVSPWRGSERSEADVREQVRERWGDDLAEEFDAQKDAMPYLSWLAFGYQVRKKEKALKSITILEVRNDKDEVIRKICRTVNLFHRRQVEPVKA